MTHGDGLELVDPKSYALIGQPHELMTRLRHEAPVAWFQPDGYPGFWALTRHADIQQVSANPEVFRNGGHLVVNSFAAQATAMDAPGDVKALIQMDPPEHKKYRQVASRWFTPKNLRTVEDRMVDSARRLVDKMAAHGADTTFDFVTEIAALHPLRLIAHLMGIDEADEPVILDISNKVFGSDDPEFIREGGRDAAFMDALKFFYGIVEDRKREPRDDLATTIATAEVNGEPIGLIETLSYYLILLTAGHDTTRAALSHGLVALVEHPAEMDKLRSDPALCTPAAEEIVRWVTPVNHMCRNVAADHDVHGVPLKAGDLIALFYASANRDEDVFEDPFAFRVDRTPNPHLGFGTGEHFCLGANLARMEIRVFLAELLPRLHSVELAGPPERMATNFVTGLKHLPIRCTVV